MASLAQAEEEAKSAVQIYRMYWGEYSVKLAHAFCTLGQIYHKMDKLDMAEEKLLEAATIYRMSLSPRSNFQSLMRATLGTFYRDAGKPMLAIEHLSECVDQVCELTARTCSSIRSRLHISRTLSCFYYVYFLASCGFYLRWVAMAHEALIACYRATNQIPEAGPTELAKFSPPLGTGQSAPELQNQSRHSWRRE